MAKRKRNRVKAWDRKLWGVVFSSPRSEPMLISCTWDTPSVPIHRWDGEPMGALRFTTFQTAFSWCKSKMAQYKDRQDGLEKWRFHPVRVRERVEVIK